MATSSVTNVENLVPIAKAGKLFMGANPSLPTILRWATHGVLNADRTARIRLQSRVLGGRRFTTAEWAAQFISECSAESNAPSDEALPPSGDASKALAALGC